MLKLAVLGASLAVASAEKGVDLPGGAGVGSYTDSDLYKLQGSSYKVDSALDNIHDVGMIGTSGETNKKEQEALFKLIATIDKFDARSAASGYKTSAVRSLTPELADALDDLNAEGVSYFDRSTDNPLQQYLAWGGKMDYSSEELHGKGVAKGMAAYYLDTANPVMNGAGPNQVSQIDYGSAAGVRYLVATVENFKPLALKDLYVDFSLSLDGEEFYYQVYQLALAVNDEGKIVAIGATNGRDMKDLMQNDILPKVISAAKKSKGEATSATQLVEVRRSYAALVERRERVNAQRTLSQARSAPAAFPVSGMSGLFFAAGLFSSLLGVTFVGARFMNTRTVNVGNPLLGEP